MIGWMNLSATYCIEHRVYRDDNDFAFECYVLYIDNKLTDAFSTKELAEEYARQHALENK